MVISATKWLFFFNLKFRNDVNEEQKKNQLPSPNCMFIILKYTIIHTITIIKTINRKCVNWSNNNNGMNVAEF